MAKRLKLRVLRSNRTYTIFELAQLLGVSVACVRSWARDGLPLLTAQRPYLILGSAARDYLQQREHRAKVPLQPNQLYCLSCRAARRPWGNMVDLIEQEGATARIMGLCAQCQTPCNRMIARARIPLLHETFDVTRREGSEP
ncbi:helix-turn-helix domain-containing protein [Fluviibacterium sp. S390]|uniref:helix-turn-helix domain-containing protein n=1 Tax=Fluviibacterium sp. S390 TaxID=3415139 RepID=UPI003C7A9A53